MMRTHGSHAPNLMPAAGGCTGRRGLLDTPEQNGGLLAVRVMCVTDLSAPRQEHMWWKKSRRSCILMPDSPSGTRCANIATRSRTSFFRLLTVRRLYSHTLTGEVS